MTKTIAMTGATGFAGRHAVEALLAKGHRLRALVRNPAAAGLPEAVEVVAGGLDDPKALARLAAGADALLHVAGAVSAIGREGYFAANAQGTAAVVKAAAEAGVARFVHISSLAAREPAISGYAASKRAAETAVEQAAGRLSAVILRPPAIYGPGDKATLPLLRELTRPVAVIPSTARARFSLIHAGDLAAVMVEAVGSRQEGVFELSDGREGGYGWLDLIAVAEVETGRRIRPVFLPEFLPRAVGTLAELMARLRGRPGMVNRGKIAELYHPDWVARGAGWPLAAPTGFVAGLAGTLKWYRDHGWLPPVRASDRSGNRAKQETNR